MSRLDEIMLAAMDYADERVMVVHGRSNAGGVHRSIEVLREAIAAALADAERKGAEAMRARIFAELGAHYGDATGMHLAVARELDSIRALPMPTGGQS